MSTLKSCCTFMLTLTLASAAVLAIPVAPPGYQIETVATYAPDGLGQVRDLAIDPDGVIYVTHRGTESLYINGSITRIDSTGIETEWKNNLEIARSIIWAGGTAFGENLYTVDSSNSKIYKLDTSGNMVLFVNSGAPSSIDIDRNGSFGGDMFGVRRGSSGTKRIKPDGSMSLFSSWPSSSFVEDIAISPTSKYDGNMFVTYDSVPVGVGNGADGIYKIDTSGNATRFAPSIGYTHFLEFDTSGLMFDNDLFVIGLKDGVEGMHVWRIDELGNAEDFMGVGWAIAHMAFGSDGAMYLSKYNETEDITEIYRVSPVPPIAISIDIEPNNCVNPLNVKSKGVLSVAILGSEVFNVYAVDITTIALEGVSPIRSSFGDVSSPSIETDGCPRGPDGYVDILLKFDNQEIAAALGDLTGVPNKTELLLTLGCKLMDDETNFEGTDFVSILNPKGSQGPKDPKGHQKPKKAKKK